MFQLPVEYRAHRDLHRGVLGDGVTGDAAVGGHRRLRLAIDEVVVLLVLAHRVPAIPAAVALAVELLRPWANLWPTGRAARDGRVVRDPEDHRVSVVHRHPGRAQDLLAKEPRRWLSPEGEQELTDAPICVSRISGPLGAVNRAVVGVELGE